MAEHYRFFNETVEDPRDYQAADYAEYFKMFLTNGVFNDGNSLELTADNATMGTSISIGYAFLNGYMYKNDAPLVLTHAAADATQDRIDRVIIRLDLSTRSIKGAIKAGTKADNPAPPALVQTEALYEISLAQVNITAGKSFIETSQITDERMDETACGYVSSLIEIPTDQMWDDWNLVSAAIQNSWDTWFAAAQTAYSELDLNQLDVDLTTHKVALNPHSITPVNIGAEPSFVKNTGFNLDKSNLVNLDDATVLATAKAVKVAYDKAVSAKAESVDYTDVHEQKANPHNITTSKIGAETPAGAQNKADSAETNAKAYTDTHESKTNPHSDSETPAGAQAKVNTHENKTSPHSDHVKGNMRITVSATEPTSPATNDIWIDISGN